MQQRSLIFTTLFQSDIIKALTLTQSWATLVASGAKGVETRSWTTKHVGLLAIHAAQGFPRWAENLCDDEPFRAALEQAGYQKHPEATHNAWNLPLGQIIAIAWLDRVEHITPDYSVSEQERAFGDYSPGRYAWHFLPCIGSPRRLRHADRLACGTGNHRNHFGQRFKHNTNRKGVSNDDMFSTVPHNKQGQAD